MQRLASVLLAMFAVVVLAGAVYVIADNKAPASDRSQNTPVTAPTTSATVASSAAPSDAAKPVIAFLGDDWTTGKGASSRDKRFTTLLAADLDATERNFGKNGAGYASGYLGEIDEVVKAEPSVVVVSGGRNDVVDDDISGAEDNAGKVFAELHKRLPDAKIIAIRPFWGDSDPPDKLEQLASAVKKAAEDNDATYVDVADPINKHPNYMANDSDLDDSGHQAIADALRPRLDKLLPG